MGSEPESGGDEVKFTRFHEFFPMPRNVGKEKVKINMRETTSVYTQHSFCFECIITSFSHRVSDYQSLELLPLPNTLLLTAINATYLN